VDHGPQSVSSPSASDDAEGHPSDPFAKVGSGTPARSKRPSSAVGSHTDGSPSKRPALGHENLREVRALVAERYRLAPSKAQADQDDSPNASAGEDEETEGA
jgi:hypothetical protein